MINEFKYHETSKIWPSPLSLSLYSTFKDIIIENRYYYKIIFAIGKTKNEFCDINHCSLGL